MAQNGTLTDFAIAGADQKFVWGDAVIDGDTVVVSSPSIASPVAVRYGWLDIPLGCHLFNKEGLPASPFRTDDWPPAP
jgi:sialate O-acetylesterase